MPAETAEIAEGLRAWWPLVGAIVGQLLALGGGIVIMRLLVRDFAAHDKKDDDRFRELRKHVDDGNAEITRRIDRIMDGRHER